MIAKNEAHPRELLGEPVPLLLTVGEVATVLRKSEKAVYTLVEQGLLPRASEG